MREIDMASVDESHALAVRHPALVDRTISRSGPALSRCYYKGMPSTSKDDEPTGIARQAFRYATNNPAKMILCVHIPR